MPIVDEIREILGANDVNGIDEKDAKRIFDKTTALSKEEEQLIHPSEKTLRKFYRAGMKLDGNVKVICPNCGASPWNYKSGSCQLCGNTPATTNE